MQQSGAIALRLSSFFGGDILPSDCLVGPLRLVKIVKAALIFLLLAATGVATLFFFRHDPEFQLNLAKEAFLLGDLSECRRHLSEVASHLPPERVALYKGYLARAEGDMELSTSLFESALEMALADGRENATLEATLNLCLNGYLTGDGESLKSWSQEAHRTAPTHPWTRIALGATAYANGEYQEARILLCDLAIPHPPPDWLTFGVGTAWDGVWRRLALAHCAIRCGDLAEGRALLNEEPREQLSGPAIESQTFLMGLSYARQAADLPVEMATPYYRLAQSYFEQLPAAYSNYPQERVWVAESWCALVGRLFAIDQVEETAHCCQLLERWSCLEEIERGAVALAERIASTVAPSAEERAERLYRLLPSGEWRRRIAFHLSRLLSEAIASGETSLLAPLYRVAIFWSPEPILLSSQTAHQLALQISLGILADDSLLSETSARLAVWRETDYTSQGALDLARMIVLQCAHLGGDSCDTEKIRAILLTAADLPLDPIGRDLLNEQIAECLTSLRAFAQSQNDASGVLTWERVADRMGLVIFDSSGVDEIANLLADADYLYRVGRFTEALQRATLVRRADPTDRAACRLSGLCCCQLRRYEEALLMLTDLNADDWVGREALAISMIERGQRQEGTALLLALAQERVLNDCSYFALATSAISRRAPEEARVWLGSILEPSVESHLLHLYAEGLSGQWGNAMKWYRALPPLFQTSPPVMAFLANGYIDQHRVGLARKAVATALKEDGPLDPRVDLIETVPEWAAARLLYEVEGDLHGALAALEEIPSKWPETLLMRGAICLQIGDLDRAEELLQEAFDRGQAVAALLAETLERKGMIEDAALVAMDDPLLLRQIGRFDLAGTEVTEPFHPLEGPSTDLAVAYEEWQSHPGRVSPLMRYARLALSRTPPIADEELLNGLRSAVQRWGQLPELFYLLGQAEELNGLSPLHAYEQAVELSPGYLDAWQGLAHCQSGERAIEALQQIVQLAPSDFAAWDRLGDWHLGNGDVEEANQCWDRSRQLSEEE